MPRELIFVLGGARSGKSAFAERLAAQGGRVLYVATAEALDDDMRRRIDAHRSQRPAHWATLEEPLDLPAVLPAALEGYDTCLLDCITLWTGNLLLKHEEDPDAERKIVESAGDLMRVYEQSGATWIVVSNEVGLGVVPPTALGSRYRDALGRVNQLLAARADRVYLLVAGLAMELKSMGAVPLDRAELRRP